MHDHVEREGEGGNALCTIMLRGREREEMHCARSC